MHNWCNSSPSRAGKIQKWNLSGNFPTCPKSSTLHLWRWWHTELKNIHQLFDSNNNIKKYGCLGHFSIHKIFVKWSCCLTRQILPVKSHCFWKQIRFDSIDIHNWIWNSFDGIQYHQLQNQYKFERNYLKKIF